MKGRTLCEKVSEMNLVVRILLFYLQDLHVSKTPQGCVSDTTYLITVQLSEIKKSEQFNPLKVDDCCYSIDTVVVHAPIITRIHILKIPNQLLQNLKKKS